MGELQMELIHHTIHTLFEMHFYTVAELLLGVLGQQLKERQYRKINPTK